MILYVDSNFASPYALVAYVSLLEKELTFDIKPLELFANAHHEPIEFAMPPSRFGTRWMRTLDTADTLAEGDQVDAGGTTLVVGRSLIVLRRLG